MNSKEEMLKLSMAMYMMDDDGVEDIITLLIPHMKYVIGKYINFLTNNVIDIEKLPKEINDILGYERFPRTIVGELLNRLKKDKVVSFDRRLGWILNIDLSDFVQDYENKQKENDEKYNNFIVSLRKYLVENCPNKDILKLTDNQLSDKVFEYLINQGLIISNHFEIVNTIKDDNNPFNYFFTEFILDSNLNNVGIVNTITKMVEGAYLANAIYNCGEEFGIKKLGNLECYIDTSIMLYLLNLKEPLICDSYIEILNLYKSVGIKCKCLKNVVKEIRYIVTHYSNHEIHYGNKKLLYFDSASSFEGEKSNFLNNLESKIKNLKIEIVGGEATFKNYCEKNKDKFERLKNDIDTNIYYGKESALDTDVNSIMYVLDKRGDYEFDYIKDARSYFVTSNLNLVKTANKSLNIMRNRIHLSPIISINYFTNLIWVFDMKINSKVTKNRILSIAQQSNIIKDGFVAKLEYIFKKNENQQVSGYSFEQIIQDALILRNVRKKSFNNENNIDIHTIECAISEKENYYINFGKNEASKEIVKKQCDNFEKQYKDECEEINHNSQLQKNKLKKRISLFTSIALAVGFIIATVIYIILKLNHQLNYLDMQSIVLLLIDLVLAVLTLYSSYCAVKQKSFIIHNKIYLCFVNKIEIDQNIKLSNAKKKFEENIKLICDLD